MKPSTLHALALVFLLGNTNATPDIIAANNAEQNTCLGSERIKDPQSSLMILDYNRVAYASLTFCSKSFHFTFINPVSRCQFDQVDLLI